MHDVSMNECEELVTKTRTFTIWKNWLQYPDGTPADLPRPDIDHEFKEDK